MMTVASSLTSAVTAMHRDTSFPVAWSRVVIMPNLQALTNLSRAWILSCVETVVSLFACVYGSAGLSPVSVFEKVDMVVVWLGILLLVTG